MAKLQHYKAKQAARYILHSHTNPVWGMMISSKRRKHPPALPSSDGPGLSNSQPLPQALSPLICITRQQNTEHREGGTQRSTDNQL